MRGIIPSKIKAYGHIEIGGKVIPFENKVNAAFLGAPQYLLDMEGLTGQASNTPYLGNIPATNFYLMQESPDFNMESLYTKMGNIPIANFVCTQVSMYKTTIRAGGTIDSNGTVRSAGFNVLTLPAASTIPNLNSPRRTVRLPLTNSLSLVNPASWVYYAEGKTLYNLEAGGSIYKIPFDMETGIMGSVSLVSSAWVPINGYNFCTNGVDKAFAYGSSNTKLKMFDFATETVSEITLSTTWDFPHMVAWDTSINQIRCIDQVYIGGVLVNGYTIALDGTITVNTGLYSKIIGGSSRTPRMFHANYWETDSLLAPYSATAIGAIANIDEHERTRWNFIQDSDNIRVNANFNSVTPTLLNMIISRKFDTSISMLAIPETSVSAGQSFSVEYTFEVIDAR